VRLFTEAGAHVAFSYRQARDQAEALRRSVRRRRALRRHPAGPDHSRRRSCPGDRRRRRLGRLDVLVANHGIWPSRDAPVVAMAGDPVAAHHGRQSGLVFGLAQAAIAQFDRQGPPGPGEASGHIVLISSTAGQRGEANHADYAVTKARSSVSTKSLSSELAPRGIRVNCVAPGWVATEMSASTLGDPKLGPQIAAAIPLGRVGSPREIAGPILFLCTPLAGFISGEVLNVNGGAVLAG